jgi:hypothetical protein
MQFDIYTNITGKVKSILNKHLFTFRRKKRANIVPATT